RRGVRFRTRRDWQGWDEAGALVFRSPEGTAETDAPDATVLALGGASWPRLGTTGDWAGLLAARGVPVLPFRPANCGFGVAWTGLFRTRFAGTPLKRITLTFAGHTVPGDAMVADYGLEGGPIYTIAAALRDALEASGPAMLTVDLRPDLTADT